MINRKIPIPPVISLVLVLAIAVISCSSTSQVSSPDQQEPVEAKDGSIACQDPPSGMVCIPGGYSFVGALPDDSQALAHEKPMSKLYIKTFYIDKFEITNEEYDRCVADGFCSKWWNIRHPSYQQYRQAQQPATPLTWKQSHDYCRWAGKRLPTEAEWEKVARGGEKNTKYPWGNAEPNCNLASYEDCNITSNIRGDIDSKPINPMSNVGSFPAGHYGVYDMAGNGYEWVNDWATTCRSGCGLESCGSACLGDNPLGPCSGKYPCETLEKKILKGGSWWWPATQMRASWRRFEKIDTGGHRLSARCAADSPSLTHAPGWMLRYPPIQPPDPSPPSQEQLAILHTLETDTLNKPLCEERYKSPAHCKDPESYVMSNESRLWLFSPYMRNLGGGYAGVAADANYTFIAHARSRWVWLFDFDVHIVNLHRVIKALVIRHDNPNDFASSLSPKNFRSTLNYIRSYYERHPELSIMESVMVRYRDQLYPYYRRNLVANRTWGDFGWLRNEDAYRYIRLLFRQNRIAIAPGDMLKEKTIRSIADSARKLKTVIRIYYPSNAEEFWEFSDTYKKNILSLPFDEGSIVIRTIHEYPWHPSKKKRPGWAGFWHYVVHGAKNYQQRLMLPDYYKIHHFRYERILPTEYRDFSTIHLPAVLPEGTPRSYLE